MSDKMDRQGVRTASDLEQKYQFGKSFAEVMGIAQDAQETAQKAVSLDANLTAEEIYNRLTNNGQSQGLYRDDEGNLFVNAAYIYALETMFAKSVSVSAEVFLEPEQEEVETIQKHLLGKEIIPIYNFPLYDFNDDGDITLVDLSKAQKASMGIISLADWKGAVKSNVTMTLNMSNPDKAIRIQGKNMWGRDIDRYVGINFSNIKQKGLADYVVEEGTSGIWKYRKWASGIAECWGKTDEVEINMNKPHGSLYYTQHAIDLPSGFFAHVPSYVDVNSLSTTGLINVSVYGLSNTKINIAVSNAQDSGMYMAFMVKAIGNWK